LLLREEGGRKPDREGKGKGGKRTTTSNGRSIGRKEGTGIELK